MPLHTPDAAALAGWLHDELVGALLQKVRCPASHTVVLELRRPGRTVRLLLAVEPALERFHTVERAPVAPPRPLALQGLLRKELRGPVQGVGLVGGDRILRIDFGELAVVAVLFPPRADILLLDSDDRVIGSARGTLDRGDAFTPPPAAGRAGRRQHPDLSGASLDAAVRQHFGDLAHDRAMSAARRRVTRRLRSVERTLARRTAEADRADEADGLQRTADLLQGSFHLLARGQATVDVPDYYEGGTARIALDPARPPRDNVDLWYRRARKARRAAQGAATRRDEAATELAALRSALARIDDGDSTAGDLLAPPTAPRARKVPRGQRLPYRSFYAGDGTEFRVGRGGRDNDELSFRHSRGNDLWLHVRGRPGAHVVIVRPGPQPTTELLVRGAQLALKYSGLLPGTRAEVSWTRVKELRKPSGLAPGMVLLRKERVLYVEYDADAVEALSRARV